jgi:hypothetical protein
MRPSMSALGEGGALSLSATQNWAQRDSRNSWLSRHLTAPRFPQPAFWPGIIFCLTVIRELSAF